MEGMIHVKKCVLLMTIIGFISSVMLFVASVNRYQNHPVKLLKIQTEVSDLFVNTHKAVPVVLLLSFPVWALWKEGESLLHKLERWFGATLLFFMAFFRLVVFAGTKRAAQIKGVSKGLLQLYAVWGGFFINKIHTGLVCAATSPVRHWYLFGVCPVKSISC